MANNPLARHAVPPPTLGNPLARYAKSEKGEREVPVPPAGSGRAVRSAVRNAKHRKEEARRQRALKALQRARELEKKWERQRAERVSKERVERAVSKSAKSFWPDDPDPFDREKGTMSDNLDYKTHQRAAAIKRGGAEPQRLANAIRTGARAGRVAARAVPVVGTIATAYDIANVLGGPPTKDPSKFRNYKGIPGVRKPPK